MQVIHLFLIWLLLFSRAMASQSRDFTNISLPILHNTTSISLVPYCENASPDIQRYENITNEYFPLFNPFYNAFPENFSSPFYQVEKDWVKKGEKKIKLLKIALNSRNQTPQEKEWLSLEALPRMTFLWSLYELAVQTPMLSPKFQLGLKPLLAHAFIRIVGFQQHYQLQLYAHYFSGQHLLANQALNNFHILAIIRKESGFIPLWLVNPPEYLLGKKAIGDSLYSFWAKLLEHPNTLIGDPQRNIIFSPYHYPQAINVTAAEGMGIFSGFDHFLIPDFVSEITRKLIQAELQQFAEACTSFAIQEEKRFLASHSQVLTQPSHSPEPNQRNRTLFIS